MGICGFEINEPEEKLITYPFNFYILPFSDEILNKRFSSQASTFEFLMNNNFDFNKLFYEGLQYISNEDKERIQSSQERRNVKDKFRSDNIERSTEYQAFVNLYWEKIEIKLNEVIKGKENNIEVQINIKFVKVKIYKYFEMKLETGFPSLQFSFNYDSEFLPERTILNIHISKDNRGYLNEDTTEENDTQFGFMEIINLLIELKKPMITHNGFIDILHLYDKFVEHLPENQSEFKSNFSKYFPIIYDTKFMLNNSNVLFSETNKYTALYDSYVEALKFHGKTITVDKNFSYEIQEGSISDKELILSHEAGFDSLMTGVLFFRNVEKLNISENIKDEISKGENLKYFRNKIPLGGLKYPFNLEDGKDRYSNESELVFHCHVISANYELKKLLDLIQGQFGDIDYNIIYGDNIEFIFKFIKQKDAVLIKQELEEYGGRKICKIKTFNIPR